MELDILQRRGPQISRGPAKELALQKIHIEVSAMLSSPMGEVRLAAWLESPDGEAWLLMAGLGDLLTTRSSSQLAQAAFRNGPRLLYGGGRCPQCAHCLGDGRRRCELGMWEKQGRKSREYAIATIRNWSRRGSCEHFEEGE